MGSSESSGETSPCSDLKGAPKRRRAVGVLSSLISHLTCSETSSRLRSAASNRCQHCSRAPIESRRHFEGNLQCSCLPVSVWPGWGTLSCLSMRSGSSTVFVGGSTAPPSRAFAVSPAAMTNRDDDEWPKPKSSTRTQRSVRGAKGKEKKEKERKKRIYRLQGERRKFKEEASQKPAAVEQKSGGRRLRWWEGSCRGEPGSLLVVTTPLHIDQDARSFSSKRPGVGCPSRAESLGKTWNPPAPDQTQQ